MSRRLLAPATLVATAVALLATATLASAADLGGVRSARLGAWTVTGRSGAPTVLAWDSFATAALVLDGRPSGGGGPAWNALAGWWAAEGGTAALLAVFSSNAAAVVDCGRRDLTVTVAVPGGTGGLVLKRSGNDVLYVHLQPVAGGTQVELGTGGLTGGGNRTVLGTATVAAGPTPTVSARYAGGTVTVTVDGVPALTRTLPTGVASRFGSSTEAGIYGRPFTARLDDFRCEVP